jgi:hypothetical protein
VSLAPHRIKQHYGLVILISADYELQRNTAQILRMHPLRVLAVVHNAKYQDMSSLLNISTNVHLLALSPHVADSLSEVTRRPVQWFLPVSSKLMIYKSGRVITVDSIMLVSL